MWLRKAADEGFAMTQYMLGMSYEHGVGVAKEEKDAVTWYRRVADQGDEAQTPALATAVKCILSRFTCAVMCVHAK